MLVGTNSTKTISSQTLGFDVRSAPPESYAQTRSRRRQSEDTSSGCKPRLFNPFDFRDHTPSSMDGRTTGTLSKLFKTWRRDRDSNPGYPFEYTRFPSVRLQPLGHLSVGKSVLRKRRNNGVVLL